jgi:hypothetical protein
LDGPRRRTKNGLLAAPQNRQEPNRDPQSDKTEAKPIR